MRLQWIWVQIFTSLEALLPLSENLNDLLAEHNHLEPVSQHSEIAEQGTKI